MFALNLKAVASEVGWLHPSTLGWMVIAIAWSIIGALWLAGSFLTAQTRRNLRVRPWSEKPGEFVVHKARRSKHEYLGCS
jgi:hypothetical protein